VTIIRPACTGTTPTTTAWSPTKLFGGLYGVIVVEDAEALPVTRERVMVVSDISLDASGQILTPSVMEQMMGREGSLVLVNGQAAPVLEARPGERERWRVVNACSARYLSLRLDGQVVQLLGRDSGRLAESLKVEDVLLAPGNRADLIVTAGRRRSVLRAEPFDRGDMMAAMMGGGSISRSTSPVDLAIFTVRGSPRGPECRGGYRRGVDHPQRRPDGPPVPSARADAADC